jgi:hypothetical protein
LTPRRLTALAAVSLIAVLVLAAFAPLASAQTPAHVAVPLAGTMRDIETGEPLAGTVTIAGEGSAVRVVNVAAAGAIAAGVAAPGTYTLTYASPGYATDSSTVRVERAGLTLEPMLAREGVTTAVRFDVRGMVRTAAVSTFVPPDTIRVYRVKLARVDVVPFHQMGRHKYEQLGIPYSLTDTAPASAEDVARVEAVFRAAGVAARAGRVSRCAPAP